MINSTNNRNDFMLDLSKADEWWREVGQPNYREACELVEKELMADKKAKAERNIIRRRDVEHNELVKQQNAGRIFGVHLCK